MDFFLLTAPLGQPRVKRFFKKKIQIFIMIFKTIKPQHHFEKKNSSTSRFPLTYSSIDQRIHINKFNKSTDSHQQININKSITVKQIDFHSMHLVAIHCRGAPALDLADTKSSCRCSCRRAEERRREVGGQRHREERAARHRY